MGKADLHIHTTASDGRLSPEEVPALASENGLEVIAITDHDTIDGYFPASEAGERIGVEVLPGVELTCDFNSRESHLLAYCFDPEDPDFLQLLAHHKKARLDRIEWIVGQLTQQGLDIDKNEVRAEAAGGNVGRPHVASVLVKKGYVGSAKEAFIRYLGNHALGPIQSYYVSHEEAVERIKGAGGATILAHPGVLYSREEIEQWIDAGLDGLEVVHSSHNYDQQKKYREMAEQHNLLMTGGSDYHGDGEGYLRNFGVITTSLAQVEKLKQMTRQRKKISV
ncbi:PHP domain-containing protein [Halalkalibaculum sp. DA3122]|uniref:PHP domain-containing protein n=1 Tax=Halalkalibaculum sp. DA3122 TaxID=3373607 RepID=UPI0037547E52